MARRSSSDHSPDIEKRAFNRRAASRKVFLVSGRTALKCALVDWAEGGARVRVPAKLLPEGDLYLIDPRLRKVHLTRPVWQSDREIGLQFIETGVVDGAAGASDTALMAKIVFAEKLARAQT